MPTVPEGGPSEQRFTANPVLSAKYDLAPLAGRACGIRELVITNPIYNPEHDLNSEIYASR